MRQHERDATEARMITLGRTLRERYVMLERLGDGAVYKALDRYRSALPEAQRCVALKILHSGGTCSEQRIADLRRELHPAQSLSHRNIVNIHELDRDADVVFFTMEFLDGERLSSVIERVRPAGMRAAQAWQLIRQLAAGLQHAHERGVVHGNLSPRNVFITRQGELRILNFGPPDHPGPAGYASCEQLEGRAAEAPDDLYALACICSELLTGRHPFESRPATLARDFGVRPVRPAGLGSRQWRMLQRGLSWHRGGRAMGVGAWMRQLVNDGGNQEITPLQEVVGAGAARGRIPSRAGAAVMAVSLTVALCIPQLWSSSAPEATDVSGPAKPESATTGDSNAVPLRAEPATPDKAPPAQGLKAVPPTMSADSSPVRSGDRFVEVRVRRNQASKNTTFTWWTETATAKQGVDFEPQEKAIQTFPAGGRSTRFYVKLLTNPARAERGYFYVAIAQPGHHESSGKVTRLQIWLPRSRDQLQARR